VEITGTAGKQRWGRTGGISPGPALEQCTPRSLYSVLWLLSGLQELAYAREVLPFSSTRSPVRMPYWARTGETDPGVYLDTSYPGKPRAIALVCRLTQKPHGPPVADRPGKDKDMPGYVGSPAVGFTVPDGPQGIGGPSGSQEDEA
jgi:hypothetical protein